MVLAIQALVPTVGLFLALRAVLGVWLAGVTATLSVMTKLRGAGRSRRRRVRRRRFGAGSGLGSGTDPRLGVVALGGIPALYLVVAAMMLALGPAGLRSQVPRQRLATRIPEARLPNHALLAL